MGKTRSKPPDPKLESLRHQRSLNPRPHRVVDPLFVSADFFDARDLVQVKYEMVRRVRLDGLAVSHSAQSFGFSRPSFYQAQADFERGGLPALVPEKRGPRRAHKLSAQVVDFSCGKNSRRTTRRQARRNWRVAFKSASESRSTLAASSGR